jgi:hypothetical protein
LFGLTPNNSGLNAAQLLVGERGWTPDRWERWSADLACAQRLGPATRPPA